MAVAALSALAGNLVLVLLRNAAGRMQRESRVRANLTHGLTRGLWGDNLQTRDLLYRNGLLCSGPDYQPGPEWQRDGLCVSQFTIRGSGFSVSVLTVGV